MKGGRGESGEGGGGYTVTQLRDVFWSGPNGSALVVVISSPNLCPRKTRAVVGLTWRLPTPAATTYYTHSTIIAALAYI